METSFVQRRGIYKDVFGTPADRARADYQLRANFPIAMAVAPELFEPEHALRALKMYHAHLIGPLGVATLDPADPDYRPYYDNANDGHDRAVAKGWNYHQVRAQRWARLPPSMPLAGARMGVAARVLLARLSALRYSRRSRGQSACKVALALQGY
jgi:hypothetical protein